MQFTPKLEAVLDLPLFRWTPKHEKCAIATVAVVSTYYLVRKPLQRLLSSYFTEVAYSGDFLKAVNEGLHKFREDMVQDIRQYQKEHPARTVRILEIGMGPGCSMEYYPKDVQVIGCEPNDTFAEQLTALQSTYSNLVKVLKCPAENVSQIQDDTIDFVVSTLVLCSVQDQQKCINEIRRVLVKDGRFYFFEHQGATDSYFRYIFQVLYNPIWGLMFNGCRLTRPTTDLIKRNLRMAKVNFGTRFLDLYCLSYANGYASKQ